MARITRLLQAAILLYCAVSVVNLSIEIANGSFAAGLAQRGISFPLADASSNVQAVGGALLGLAVLGIVVVFALRARRAGRR